MPTRRNTLRSNTWNIRPPYTMWDEVYTQGAKFCAFTTVAVGSLIGHRRAAAHLFHFLCGSGDLLDVGFGEIIANNQVARNSCRVDLRDAQRAAEEFVLTDNCPAYITSASETAHTLGTGDLFYAIGQYTTWGQGEVIKRGNCFTMNWHYFFRDVYDWEVDENKGTGVLTDYDLAMLHRYGKSRDFNLTGRYDVTIKWSKGRYVKKKDLLDSNEIIDLTKISTVLIVR